MTMLLLIAIAKVSPLLILPRITCFPIFNSDERHGKPGFANEKKPRDSEEDDDEDLNETNYDEV